MKAITPTIDAMTSVARPQIHPKPNGRFIFRPPCCLALILGSTCEGSMNDRRTTCGGDDSPFGAELAGGASNQKGAARPVRRQMPQVPGLGWSILCAPTTPTGTLGNVATMIVGIEPVFLASPTSTGSSTNDWPGVYLVMTQWGCRPPLSSLDWLWPCWSPFPTDE